MSGDIRHFTDLSSRSRNRVARHARRRRRAQGAAEGRRALEAARRQGAGDDLRQAVDAHARLLRRRHAPARRRDDHADRHRDAARPLRNHRRHGQGPVALCRRHHDPHHRPCAAARAHRACLRACHQRADRRHASLPAHGRHHDLRGASRPGGRQDLRLDRRRQQRAAFAARSLGALRLQAQCRDAGRQRAAGEICQMGEAPMAARFG